jgi:hypothetical protein
VRNNFVRVHISAWVLLGSLRALADPSVELVGLDGRSQSSPSVPAIFGGLEQKLDLNVYGFATRVGTSLNADLFQSAGSLMMPLKKNIQLDEHFTISPKDNYGEQVTFKFPEVERQTEMLLFLEATEGRPPHRVALGALHFQVFPTSVTKELADLLQPKPDGSESIVVFGPGPKFRHFLAGKHVLFDEGGDGVPDRVDPKRIYFGELTTAQQFQEAQDRSAGACMVLFSPDESLPAGVYAEHSSLKTFVHVTSPLLNDLNVDPRAQMALIKIIHFLSTPPSAN